MTNSPKTTKKGGTEGMGRESESKPVYWHGNGFRFTLGPGDGDCCNSDNTSDTSNIWLNKGYMQCTCVTRQDSAALAGGTFLRTPSLTKVHMHTWKIF
jgi:hypothetical protein